MQAIPVGIITKDGIDSKASNFEGLRDLQGGNCSAWCDRVAKRRISAEVRGWAHLNRKCCDRGQ